MDDGVRPILKNALARHGRELLDDPQRCENVLAENFPAGAEVEVRALIAALKQDVPQRLIGMPASNLTQAAIDNYAKGFAAHTGLRDDIARWAVASWASGLDLPIADGTLRQEPLGAATKPEAKEQLGEKSPQKPSKPGRRPRYLIGVVGAILLMSLVGVFTYFFETDWKTYVMPQFGIRIEYPPDLMPNKPPTNGGNADVVFTNADGASVLLSAVSNTAHLTTSDIWKNIQQRPNPIVDLDDVTIQDHRLTDHWLTIEGVKGTGPTQRSYWEIDLLSRNNEVSSTLIVTCPVQLDASYTEKVDRMWKYMAENNP